MESTTDQIKSLLRIRWSADKITNHFVGLGDDESAVRDLIRQAVQENIAHNTAASKALAEKYDWGKGRINS